jgi:hypothetical protein
MEAEAEGKSTVKFETVSIVAGGWSFSLVDPHKLPGYVIAVNDAAYNLHKLGVRVDEVVSMDRLWSELRYPWLQERAGLTYLRDAAAKKLGEHDWLRRFQNVRGTGRIAFAPADNWLNGDHSGHCALNRAYQIKPNTLLLFGFDFGLGPQGQRHWYPYQGVGPQDGSASGYKPEIWTEQMTMARIDFNRVKVTVINVSRNSRIRCFTKAEPKDLGLHKEVVPA